jgi:hypothetical protein
MRTGFRSFSNRAGDDVSKRFKGKDCAYCPKVKAKATTDDDVFAREFFTLADRHDLPKAPARQKCNGDKGKFEHYLTATLPFAGRHAQAVENLQGGVLRRLDKSQKLSRELLGSLKPGWIRENGGLYQKTSIMDFDSEKFQGWLKFVGRGLAWHRWNLYPRPADDLSVMLMSDENSAIWAAMTSGWRNARRVVQNLGNGTVEYVGVQAEDPPRLTVWTVRMYGGLVLSDDRHKRDGEMQSCGTWWVITGPPELNETLSRLK